MEVMERVRRGVGERLTGEERRARILQAARQLFAENGYSGTTMQEIADQAGISTTLIFQHFSNKEKLFEAVIRASYGKEPLKEELDGRLLTDGDEEACRAVAAHNFRYARGAEGRELMRLQTYISLEQPSLFRQHLLEEGAEAVELVADYFARRIAAGAFKEINPHIAAHAFLGMVRHYLWNAQSLGAEAAPDFPDDEVIDTFVRIFLDGIRK